MLADPATGQVLRKVFRCYSHSCPKCGPELKMRWHSHLLEKLSGVQIEKLYYYEVAKTRWSRIYNRTHAAYDEWDFVHVPVAGTGKAGREIAVLSTAPLPFRMQSPQNRTLDPRSPELALLLQSMLFNIPADAKHPVQVSKGLRLHAPKTPPKGHLFMGFSMLGTKEADAAANAAGASIRAAGDSGEDRIYHELPESTLSSSLGFATFLRQIGVRVPPMKYVEQFVRDRVTFRKEIWARRARLREAALTSSA